MSKLRKLAVVSAFLLCMASRSRADDACAFVEIDLLGATSGWSADLNNHGQVVGTLQYPSDLPHADAFVWRDGQTRVLPRLEADGSAGANGINDLGWIVGTSSIDGFGAAPVLWRPSGIKLLQSDLPAVAEDINNRGQIIGNAFKVVDNTSVGECIFWDGPNSDPVDMGSLGGDGCQVAAINDLGEAVGSSWTADGERHGFIWKEGVMVDIGKPLHSPGKDSFDIALGDINNTGLAVGRLGTAEGEHPIVWSRRSGVRVLPFQASGLTVNEWGTIAGALYQADSRLLIADRHGRFRDKGSLGGWVGGVALNERFQIAWNIASEVTKAYFCQLR